MHDSVSLRGALDPKLGRHVRRAEKITGPLLVQTLWEILGKLTLIGANLALFGKTE